MRSINEVLQSVRPEVDFASTDDWLGEGLLDSLDVVTLVSELDKNFGISIRGTMIVPENFRNLAALRALLVAHGVRA
jgi:acyl carrier protein